MLKQNGKLIIGIIDKGSKWGEAYISKKAKSKFYGIANFYSVDELMEFLAPLRFKNFKVFQTLFEPPDSFKKIEAPEEGYGRGWFVVITCEK